MELSTPTPTPTIYLDVTDLLLWVRQHATVTGIQRVHLNYALHGIEKGVKFIMFHGRSCEHVGLVDDAVIEYMGRLLAGRIEPDPGQLYKLCPNARLKPWRDYREKYLGQPAKYLWHTFASGVVFHLTHLLFQRRMPAPPFKPGDVLLNVGRSWIIGGYVQNIGKLKRRHGISAQLLVHDVIPIENGQKAAESLLFTQFIKESFRAFDRFFTSSDYNRREIRKFMHQFIGAEKPIEKCLFGQNINSPSAASAASARLPHGLSQGQYLLSVGRVTAFKNQLRLLQAWAQVIAGGQDAGLRLVIVGKTSKAYKAIDELLDAAPALRERVLFLGDVSDAELDALYRGCRFTVFPSLIEGYGLPAAESISYGKFCLASHATSIPEAAGEHAGYFDPLDVDDIRTQLERFIQDETLLHEREALIRAMPRTSWAEATADLLDKASRPL